MKILSADLPASGPAALPSRTQAGASPSEVGVFRRMLAEVNGWQSQADRQIQQTLAGEKDLHEVMLSLERASLGLKVLVQVRNKMLQAYEELSRMQL